MQERTLNDIGGQEQTFSDLVARQWIILTILLYRFKRKLQLHVIGLVVKVYGDPRRACK